LLDSMAFEGLDELVEDVRSNSDFRGRDHKASLAPPDSKKVRGFVTSTLQIARASASTKPHIFLTMSMITATTWVRRGVAAAFPTKYDIDDAEISRISKLAKLQLEDAKQDLEEARNGKANEKDEESDDDEDGGVGLKTSKE
jgi:hypothetical protein